MLPGTILATEDTAANETDINPALMLTRADRLLTINVGAYQSAADSATEKSK